MKARIELLEILAEADEDRKLATVYAVVDQRRGYLGIIKGL